VLFGAPPYRNELRIRPSTCRPFATAKIQRLSYGNWRSALGQLRYDNRLPAHRGHRLHLPFQTTTSRLTRGPPHHQIGASVYRIREYEGEQRFSRATSISRSKRAESAGQQLAFSNAALGAFYRLHRIERAATAPTCGIDCSNGSSRIAGRSPTAESDYGVRWTWAGEMYPNKRRPAVGLHAEASTRPARRAAFSAPVTQNGVKYAQNP